MTSGRASETEHSAPRCHTPLAVDILRHVVRKRSGVVFSYLWSPTSRNPIGSRGGGPLTTVLCGHLWFDDPAASPLVGMLPPLLHFPAGTGGRPAAWLDP